MVRRAIKTSSFVLWPALVGIIVIANPLIRLLLTEKWMEAVPYLRIFCIVCAFQPIHTTNLNAIRAMGRSDIILRLEIIKKSIGIAILLMVINKGVYAVALSQIAYSLIAQILNTFPNRKLLDYKYSEQLRDIVLESG